MCRGRKDGLVERETSRVSLYGIGVKSNRGTTRVSLKTCKKDIATKLESSLIKLNTATSTTISNTISITITTSTIIITTPFFWQRKYTPLIRYRINDGYTTMHDPMLQKISIYKTTLRDHSNFLCQCCAAYWTLVFDVNCRHSV